MGEPICIENDVAIPMRDGLALRANVFRPEVEGRYPVILTLGPYPKDIHFADWDAHGFYPGLEEHGPLMHWETVNPEWWVPHGYVVVRADTRGTGKSPGRPSPLSMREAEDFADAIEWAGTRPYASGKVAVMGVSYFAMNAWRVATLNPPRLAAIVPWEGALDLYRDAGRHGGIASNTFTRRWASNVEQRAGAAGLSQGAAARTDERIDESQRRNHPDVSRIRVPLFSAANWGGAGLHLRGNIEGFLDAGSAYKQLRIHVGNHCAPFYSLEGRLEQKRFLDHWLKGVDTGITREPPIKLAVRQGGERHVWRHEHEWPLARTRWTAYFLDAEAATLSTEALEREASVAYDAGGDDAHNRVTFRLPPCREDIELTGPVKLRLWVSCAAGDADLMVSLRHFDASGDEVVYPGALPPDVAAAYGWLRVSHRKLDPARSLPYRPYLAHDEIQKLSPGEIVPVEIEIWPTCIVLQPGHRLELVVSSQDDPRLHPFTHTDPNDRIQTGDVRLYTGGMYDSHLLLPRIPAGE
jgi:uncharacterized protein